LDWTIELSPSARRQFAKLDRTTQLKIRRYLNALIAETEHPTQRGKPLTGNLAGAWRYRVGDYRVLCEIQNHRLVVLVIRIGHRSAIYG
jgi:mRNA interferase RelE/StbE